jgi:hypothetical protein
MKNRLTEKQILTAQHAVAHYAYLSEDALGILAPHLQYAPDAPPVEAVNLDAELIEKMYTALNSKGIDPTITSYEDCINHLRDVLAVVRSHDQCSEADPPTEEEILHANHVYFGAGNGVNGNVRAVMIELCKGRTDRIKALDQKLSLAATDRDDAWCRINELEAERDASIEENKETKEELRRVLAKECCAEEIKETQQRAEKAEAERDVLRTTLIEIGRGCDGAFLSDNVSSEFLSNVATEVKLQRDALQKKVEQERHSKDTAYTDWASKMAYSRF